MLALYDFDDFWTKGLYSLLIVKSVWKTPIKRMEDQRCFSEQEDGKKNLWRSSHTAMAYKYLLKKCHENETYISTSFLNQTIKLIKLSK